MKPISTNKISPSKIATGSIVQTLFLYVGCHFFTSFIHQFNLLEPRKRLDQVLLEIHNYCIVQLPAQKCKKQRLLEE